MQNARIVLSGTNAKLVVDVDDGEGHLEEVTLFTSRDCEDKHEASRVWSQIQELVQRGGIPVLS